jgi:ubiquinone/menaquinone biosynthesis C-methylase UbiE
MAYYDSIAKQWHEATGYKGGPFKDLRLNDILLKRISNINDRAILEIGAGNGYFLPLVLRHNSGQIPATMVVTDQSKRLLEIAKKHFKIPNAVYQLLDARQHFPFQDTCFDVILATMVFNELSSHDFLHALRECHRVLSKPGILLITVTHPDFIRDLQRRCLLTRVNGRGLTMPGAGRLRLPVMIRSAKSYRRALTQSGFQFEEEAVFPTAEVLNLKSGLRNAQGLPLALVFRCMKA